MRFLIIDDCPSRYDEFTKILDRNGDTWVITYNEDIVHLILQNRHDCDEKMVIMLDHDMPVHDGRWWAKYLVQFAYTDIPVIITSTTGLDGVREEMLNTLTVGGIRAIMNPADHIGCEAEWYWWSKGVCGE